MATSGVVAKPKLPDYVFTEKLGSGTYATVYKAFRKSGTREVVAVKCVEKSSLNRISKENLLTEIELLKSLRHDHIVQLKDFRWDDSYIYLIMEYCSGGDLSQFIKTQRTLSEYIAKHFLQQLALALEYMRSKNISHMDLKPQNILLSSQQNPVLKVADFGFAHYLIGETEAAILRGSPLYMAPEIIIHRHYNEKADLWSTGVILYECLFGRAPFASRSLTELKVKIKDTKPIEIPYGVQISDKCRDFLYGLLKRSPEDRMSYDDFFCHPFIDLEHRPSKESLDTAISIANKAVIKDKTGDYKSAISFYCQALEYFVPAIHYEKNADKKQILRKKVQQYMDRAEILKGVMKPKAVTHDEEAASTEINLYDELMKLSEDHVQLQAAVKVIKSAEQREEAEDFEKALEKYELALGALLKILQDEPKGRRKDLIQTVVKQSMDQAERIKAYLEVRQLNTQDTSSQEEEQERQHMTSTCTLQ